MKYFSKELINEAIECFKEENAVLFTEEEAFEALDGLASLALALLKPNKS